MYSQWRTWERQWVTIERPGRGRGLPLEHLGRSVCGHCRTWEDQRIAVGGPEKFRTYCFVLLVFYFFIFFPVAHRRSPVLCCQFLGSFLSCP